MRLVPVEAALREDRSLTLGMPGRDFCVVPNLGRIPILRFTGSSGPRERILARIDMAFCVAEPTPKAYWTKRLAARVAGVRSTQDGQHTDADEPDPPTQPLGTGPCGVAASSNDCKQR